MSKEIWAPISGYETIYQVSTMGRIRRISSQRILKPCICSGGYNTIHLYTKGKPSTFKISRLVATKFLPNPLDKSIVNHKNRNKLDDRLENLEWNSSQENSIHSHRTVLLSIMNILENKFTNENLNKTSSLSTIFRQLRSIINETESKPCSP